jgi:glycosyltransferase involved in cell wall biosynthesis
MRAFFLGSSINSWSGGSQYLETLRWGLSRLSKELNFSVFFDINGRLFKRINFLSIQSNAKKETLIHLPWPHGETLRTQIQWIPDLQDLILPEMFDPTERYSRAFQIQNAISRGTRFYFSSYTQESIFRNSYSGESLGVVRFATIPNFRVRVNSPIQPRKRSPYIYVPNQLWRHKNHLNFLEAFKLYRRRGGQLDLELSGAASDYRWPNHPDSVISKALSIDGVRYHGYVSSRQKINLFRGARAVFQPSSFEGWSTSIEESLSLRKPVYVSNIETHKEQLRGTKNCHFFDPLDLDSMVSALFSSEDSIWRDDCISSKNEFRRNRFLSDLRNLIIKII